MNPLSVDEFELKLIELMHGAVFALQDPEVQARIKEMLGHPEDSTMEVDPPDLDLDRIHLISVYLMQEEELAADIPAGSTEEDCIALHIALRCGLFIYGWEDYREGEPS
mgnify:CR=1 FL=1